jgi:hypothetical protein
MKTILKFSIVGMALLFALSACDLFNQLEVQCSVTIQTANPSFAVINYTASNQGQYDLTGVNLTIAAVVSPGVYASTRTPDFSLSKGQMTSGSVTVYMSGLGTATSADVIGVGMDKP